MRPQQQSTRKAISAFSAIAIHLLFTAGTRRRHALQNGAQNITGLGDGNTSALCSAAGWMLA